MSVANVSVTFGGLKALDGVTFDVRDGECLGIIGPNGAGKSTLVNVLTGLQRADRGSCTFGGTDVTGRRPQVILRHGMARTFQHPRLIRRATVIDNVVCGLHRQLGYGVLSGLLRSPGVRRREAAAYELADRWITTLGMSSVRDTVVGTLPYPDQKKCEIVRAMVTSPRLVLMDEPVSGASAVDRRDVAREIAQIKSQGVTVVVIEHDVQFLMEIADRLCALDFGQVIALDAPDVVVQHPAVIEAYLGRHDDN